MATENRSKAGRRNIHAVPEHEEEIQPISGNAPQRLKEAAVRWYKVLGLSEGYTTYGSVERRSMRIREVSLEYAHDAGEPQKTVSSVKMVGELEVSPDMCNGLGLMDQGSMTGILDEGSAIALLLKKISEGEDESIGVSQNFNFIFYQPVPTVGDKLRIVSRSMSSEKGSGSCTCEIRDVLRHRLVVSGTQIQMTPSRR